MHRRFLQAITVFVLGQFGFGSFANAQYYSTGRAAVSGGVRGAIGGGIVGGIFGGSKGARIGASIGAGFGVAAGVSAANRANREIARSQTYSSGGAYFSSSDDGDDSETYESEDPTSTRAQREPVYVSEKYFLGVMTHIPDPIKLDGNYFEFVTRDENGTLVDDANGTKTIAKVADVSKIADCAKRAADLVKVIASPSIRFVNVLIDNELHQAKEADTYIATSAGIFARPACRKRDPTTLSKWIACEDRDLAPTYPQAPDFKLIEFSKQNISDIDSQFRDGQWHSVSTNDFPVARVIRERGTNDYVVYHNDGSVGNSRLVWSEMGRVHSDSIAIGDVLNSEYQALSKSRFAKMPGVLTHSQTGEAEITFVKSVSMIEKKLEPELSLLIALDSAGRCKLPDISTVARTSASDWKELMPTQAEVPTGATGRPRPSGNSSK